MSRESVTKIYSHSISVDTRSLRSIIFASYSPHPPVASATEMIRIIRAQPLLKNCHNGVSNLAEMKTLHSGKNVTNSVSMVCGIQLEWGDNHEFFKKF